MLVSILSLDPLNTMNNNLNSKSLGFNVTDFFLTNLETIYSLITPIRLVQDHAY